MAVEHELEFRWPKGGDRLLRADHNWDRAIIFEEQELTRDVLMWDGYMNAAATLIEHCEHINNRLYRHELVYPILYCYRHGLELAMKWVIARYSRYSTVDPGDYMHHGLWKLWTTCKAVILEVGSCGDDDALKAVEQIVKDFHDLDRDSFSFRYATDKQRVVIRLPDVPFDLVNIKHVMKGVSGFFTGVDGELDHNSSAVDW